jgi:hypothetical protein
VAGGIDDGEDARRGVDFADAGEDEIEAVIEGREAPLPGISGGGRGVRGCVGGVEDSRRGGLFGSGGGEENFSAGKRSLLCLCCGDRNSETLCGVYT